MANLLENSNYLIWPQQTINQWIPMFKTILAKLQSFLDMWLFLRATSLKSISGKTTNNSLWNFKPREQSFLQSSKVSKHFHGQFFSWYGRVKHYKMYLIAVGLGIRYQKNDDINKLLYKQLCHYLSSKNQAKERKPCGQEQLYPDCPQPEDLRRWVHCLGLLIISPW